MNKLSILIILALFIVLATTAVACTLTYKQKSVVPIKTIEGTICLGSAHIVKVNEKYYVQRVSVHDDAPLLDINTGCP